MTLAFMLSVVIITVAVLFVVPSAGEENEGGVPWAVVAGVLGWAVVVHLLVELVSYRVPRAGDPVAAFRAGTVLRLALAQSVAVIGVALSFVVTTGSAAVMVVAALASLALLAVDAFPASRQVRRTEAALRSAGAPADLRHRLGAR